MNRYFKRGDVVKVWSLQSFNHGGFLKGVTAVVRQNQHEASSVLLIVPRKINGVRMLDTSYEVYEEQIKLIEKTNDTRIENVSWFLDLNSQIRSHEHLKLKSNGIQEHTGYSYAPEFFFNNDNFIELDKDKLQYPEAFI